MILGIGVDIIDNRRVEKIIKKYGKRFKKRCFSEKEILIYKKKSNQTNFFAKRYAAKEAFAKALGTGLTKGMSWKDIEVDNDNYGKPFIVLHNNALTTFNILSKSKGKIQLSLSDEKNYSVANVIIYKQ